MKEMQEMPVWSLGWEDFLEKEMGTHSSILAWIILWTEEPGGLLSMVSWRGKYDCVTNFHFHTFRGRLQLAVSGWQSPFRVIDLIIILKCFMDIVSHSAGNVLSRSGKDSPDRPLNVLLLDQAPRIAKSLQTIPVLLASWFRKICRLVASFHI